MSSNSTGKIPDAWEDDWEKLADKQADAPEQPPVEKKVSSKVTKAQRRAAQAEFNRQLWAEAESAQTFHFLEAKSSVPLKQDFKPAVTVLSRRPQIASRQAGSSGVESATAGLSRLGLSADGKDLSDSDDEANNKPPELTAEERQAKALRDREEKQRKYEEVRERLFGSSSNPGSGASSPGSTTPPPSRQHNNSGDGRGRGRNRGGGRDKDSREKRDSPGSSGKSRQLYDPGYSPRPNSSYLQRRERSQQQSTERSDSEQQAPRQPTRSPRGPDGSGRGGFGFSPRGRGA
ncbi:hypothetical protein VTN77DRAFT_6737 [Rasamsonia byssochlamydoides]|uniref:uncharacterized protein n=1 Tax=Rasamsonia byssochlamydoides TaxID=89139 RepID=UPI0037447B2B